MKENACHEHYKCKYEIIVILVFNFNKLKKI